MVTRTFVQSLLSLECVCAAALVLWVFLLVPKNTADPDIGWHLRNVAVQLDQHALLRGDVYSFTAYDSSWINHEWLAELPFYAAWRFGGITGLYILTLITIESIFLGLFGLTLLSLPLGHASRLPVALLTTLTASVLATVSFGPRTLLFGWLLLLLELYLLTNFSRYPRCLFALPVLFVIWINTHGSWLIGLTLLLVFIVAGLWSIDWGVIQCIAWTSTQRKLLGIILLLSLGALFLNPYTWHLVVYPFDLAFHQPLNIANVEEWRPLNFHSPRGCGLLISLASLFFLQLAPAACRRPCSSCDLGFLAIGTYAAVIHERFLFLAAILLMPLLARQLVYLCSAEKPPAGSGLATPVLTKALHAGLLLAMLLLTIRIRQRTSHEEISQQLPIAAITFLNAFHPAGCLFNAYEWGGYLELAEPQIPVFIDSRVDIYERNGVLRDYLAIIRLQNSLQILDNYHIRYVLFERDTPLVYLLMLTHTWKTDFDDGKVVLLERQS